MRLMLPLVNSTLDRIEAPGSNSSPAAKSARPAPAAPASQLAVAASVAEPTEGDSLLKVQALVPPHLHASVMRVASI